MQLVLMQWCVYSPHIDVTQPGRYAPRKKFMKLKDFETPFDEAPPIMDLLVLKDRPLPVLCVVWSLPAHVHCSPPQGATRDKKTRAKSLAFVDPNVTAEDVGKHMSAELGWVRVRSGSKLRESIHHSFEQGARTCTPQPRSRSARTVSCSASRVRTQLLFCLAHINCRRGAVCGL